MPGFLLRLFVCALGLAVASAIVPGMHIYGFWSVLVAAFLLGLVNAIVRPVLILLTLPFTIVTLGLFLLVINAAILGLVAGLMDGFVISGFWAAFFGSIIVSLVSFVANRYIGSQGRMEILVAR